MLPPPFVHQMQQLLGHEYPDFAAALQEPPPVSIRYSTGRKQQTANGKQQTATLSPQPSAPVPWHPQGRYLSERPVFTLDPALHAGAYYVQEAASMFLREALRQSLDFSNPLKVLDLCAAPGGKSTLLADMLPLDSLLVANEVIKTRIGPLRENLERWGCPNVAVTSAEAEAFGAMQGWFDVVVCDAPCSGEGLFRKDPDAVREWSPEQVEVCAVRQRRILAAAVEALAPGGVLAYSTCTYNRTENEGNAAWLAAEFGLVPLRLEMPADWGITVGEQGGCRFFPHRTRGEGFFIAVFRKKSGTSPRHAAPAQFALLKPLAKNALPEAARWLRPDVEARFFQTPSSEVLALPAALESDFLFLDKYLKAKWFGVNIGEFKGKDFIPSHALALSRWVSPTLPGLALSREQALLFLKKETFEIPPDTPLGWTLAQFEGLNLGWVKLLPNRMNNYLPPERRIRMAV